MEGAAGKERKDGGSNGSADEISVLAESLHAYERKVLPVLPRLSSVAQLAEAAGLKDVEVMRGLQWLSNKKLVSEAQALKEEVSLGANGERYKK